MQQRFWQYQTATVCIAHEGGLKRGVEDNALGCREWGEAPAWGQLVLILVVGQVASLVGVLVQCEADKSVVDSDGCTAKQLAQTHLLKLLLH